MKKILTSVLALLACCAMFTACDLTNKGNASDSTPDASVPSSTPEASTPEASTPEEETDPHMQALNLAKEFVYGDLVEKDLVVSKDYTLIGSTYSFILDQNLPITWTVDVAEGVTVTYDEANANWKVDVDEFAEEDIFYTLTATISDADACHSVSFTLARQVSKAAEIVPEKITAAPVENTAYKLYMYQAQKKNDLYFLGKMSGFYLATNNASNGEGFENAVDIFVEKVADKDAYYLSFTYENKKQYIGVANNWSNGSYHDNAILADSTTVADGEVKTFEFVWSEQYSTMIATLDGVKSGKDQATTETKTESFFLGTSGSYYTFGACPVGEAAESYVGCLVKMVNKNEVSAEDKVNAEKDALSVTTAFSGAVEATLPTQGTTFGDVTISWNVKEGNATVENNVLTVADPAADLTIVLTATFTCGTATTTKDVTINVFPSLSITDVTAPEEGEVYIMYMYQQQNAKNYFFTGAMSGNYLGTTTDAAVAADVYTEVADGGFKIYVVNADQSKSYITLTEYQPEGKNYYNASVSLTADGSVFTVNSQYGALCCKLTNDTYFLTTYGDKTTMGASGVYYLDPARVDSQYIVKLGIINGDVPPAGDGEGEGEVKPTEPTTLTIAEALALGATKAHNTYTTEKYYVTGKITSITSTKYGNMYISDGTSTILIYGLYTDVVSDETRYDSMATKPLVGDTIKVLSVVGQYSNSAQLKDAFLVELTPATAEELVAVEKEALTFESSALGAKEFDLPTAGSLRPEVAIAWEVTGGSEIATISNGKLIITNPAETTTVTLVAILTVNDTDADDSKEFTLVVSHLSENLTESTETFNIAASAGTLAANSLSISWASDHFNFVGEKASSTTAIRTSDSDHFRIYQGSNFTVSAKGNEGISKIVITVTESKYASVLVSSIATTGVTSSVNGTTVTITVDSGSISSLVFNASAQFRVKTFAITYLA